ncbi:MAG TPA: prephenate dehydrogenase [Sporichthyaceae bacterium]|jgi:prephenate dehydrogenase|nr:prephenate dehydrogenase [Sporichthyaceae bacterium]
MSLGSALVVGSGLMGTSVALALRSHGLQVHLDDRDRASLELAVALGAGELRTRATPRADLAVIAVPPASVATVLAELQRQDAAATYTDLASTKGTGQRAVETIADPTSYVGGHPLAGRELSGPGAARADLFTGRPWVLTPSSFSADNALAAATNLVELCEASPVLMDPHTHDLAVALVSHAPQVLASLVAARLVDADPHAVGLAGQGLRDVTRIAASDPRLWSEILASNATAVADVLAAVAADLDEVVQALRAVATDPADPSALEPVTAALRAGNLGRAQLPGKHGQPPTRWTAVPVLVPDKEGELARLLTDVGKAGINIEDMRIDHSPGQPVGLVELAVRPTSAAELVAQLRALGWSVHW